MFREVCDFFRKSTNVFGFYIWLRNGNKELVEFRRVFTSLYASSQGVFTNQTAVRPHWTTVGSNLEKRHALLSVLICFKGFFCFWFSTSYFVTLYFPLFKETSCHSRSNFLRPFHLQRPRRSWRRWLNSAQVNSTGTSWCFMLTPTFNRLCLGQTNTQGW